MGVGTVCSIGIRDAGSSEKRPTEGRWAQQGCLVGGRSPVPLGSCLYNIASHLYSPDADGPPSAWRRRSHLYRTPSCTLRLSPLHTKPPFAGPGPLTNVSNCITPSSKVSRASRTRHLRSNLSKRFAETGYITGVTRCAPHPQSPVCIPYVCWPPFTFQPDYGF